MEGPCSPGCWVSSTIWKGWEGVGAWPALLAQVHSGPGTLPDAFLFTEHTQTFVSVLC